MASPAVELQDMVLTRLSADATVQSYLGARVYDYPPEGAAMPYASFGPSDLIPEDDPQGCITLAAHSLQVDIWDQSQGRLWKAKDITAAVKKCLHQYAGELSTHRLVSIEVERAAVMLDADGITAHGIVQLVARIEEAA